MARNAAIEMPGNFEVSNTLTNAPLELHMSAARRMSSRPLITSLLDCQDSMTYSFAANADETNFCRVEMNACRFTSFDELY